MLVPVSVPDVLIASVCLCVWKVLGMSDACARGVMLVPDVLIASETNNTTLETNIRWAEAFILMYSVTDKCSFDECNRLKFLINYNKRRRRLGSNSKASFNDVPVVLVGNKTDQVGDRMVSTEDGTRRCREIGCLCFHEISIRESIDQVWTVFKDVYHLWKIHYKMPKLKRSSTEIQSPDSHPFLSFSAFTNGKSLISVMSGKSMIPIKGGLSLMS
ncbi:hypothetical protein M8J77_003829 [Diaphorina citri]|nr:hypothetical protein M8J77_003829 [Diaphorina citri]